MKQAHQVWTSKKCGIKSMELFVGEVASSMAGV